MTNMLQVAWMANSEIGCWNFERSSTNAVHFGTLWLWEWAWLHGRTISHSLKRRPRPAVLFLCGFNETTSVTLEKATATKEAPSPRTEPNYRWLFIETSKAYSRQPFAYMDSKLLIPTTLVKNENNSTAILRCFSKIHFSGSAKPISISFNIQVIPSFLSYFFFLLPPTFSFSSLLIGSFSHA